MEKTINDNLEWSLERYLKDILNIRIRGGRIFQNYPIRYCKPGSSEDRGRDMTCKISPTSA